MSKHEWKPGDVAMVTLPSGEQATGLRPLRNDGWLHSGSFAGGVDFDSIGDTDARPLVVIDPEDREQVERLYTLWRAESNKHMPHAGQFQSCLAAALREFADPTPPKPDEPQGLGAVVVDESEVEYIHLGAGLWVYGTTDGPSCGYEWPHVHAVRVLSEGVTP